MDSTNWTPELQRALNYDRKSALQIDNGKTPVLYFGYRFWFTYKSLNSTNIFKDDLFNVMESIFFRRNMTYSMKLSYVEIRF